MPNPTFQLKVGDTRPELAITITDEATGSAFNLTGATATFTMKPEKGGTVKVNAAAATIYDAANGKVKYTWQTADVDTAGRFIAEFEITLSGGGIVTFPQDGYIEVNIIEALV